MYKLASLISDGNRHGFRPETVYNYVYWSLLEKNTESFMPPNAAGRDNKKTSGDFLRDCLFDEIVFHLVPQTWPMSDRLFVDAVLPTNASKQELQKSVHELLSGVVDAFKVYLVMQPSAGVTATILVSVDGLAARLDDREVKAGSVRKNPQDGKRSRLA